MQLKRYLSSLILGIVFLTILFVLGPITIAQNTPSPDIIAIRVIPNPNHYSAERWYREQGFGGSPQSLMVDGYGAVRDGRTVYVAAANVDDVTDPTNPKLYTNIYLISYNQAAEKATLDIFGKILSRWKFNINLPDNDVCKESGAVCKIDSDCSRDDYCLSDKAEVIRDVRRLAGLTDVEDKIENFRTQYQRYPTLTSGSYIPDITMSTWPSWQNVLAQKLGSTLPLDPVNKLGDCPGYHPITCWDENNNSFADQFTGNNQLDLPDDSFVYMYESESNGTDYSICAVMESGYIGAQSGACDTGDEINIGNTTTNNPPQFISNVNLLGYSGREFSGFVEAFDPDGDEIRWSIDTIISGEDWSTWESAPVLRSTPAINQREIYSLWAGEERDYKFHIVIGDGRVTLPPQEFTITIQNPPPEIEADYFEYVVGNTPIDYSFIIRDDLTNYPLTYNISPDPGNIGFTTIPAGTAGPLGGANPPGGYYVFSFDGRLNQSEGPINLSKGYNFTFQATDNFNTTGVKNFSIAMINYAPEVSRIFNRNTNQEVYNVDKSDTPGSAEVDLIIGSTSNLLIEARDQNGNYPISFNVSSNLPSFNNYGEQINNQSYIASGTTITSPTGAYGAQIILTDSYGGESEVFDLDINVTNNPPIITSSPPSSSLIGCSDNFSYQVDAYDPDGHALTYSVTGNPGSIAFVGNTLQGPLFAESGTYIVNIIVRDEYFNDTDPAENAQTIQSFNLVVEDANFTVTAPADTTIYVRANSGVGLYHISTLFNDTVTISPAYSVLYSIQEDGGIGLPINQNTGQIQWTPDDNVNHPGVYNIIVAATTRDCYVTQTANFTLTVLANEWCGDGVVQAAQEDCDPEPNCSPDACMWYCLFDDPVMGIFDNCVFGP